MGPNHYLAPGQDQAFYRLLVKHLQLLDQVDPGSQAHGLEQPAVSYRGWARARVNQRAQGPHPVAGSQAYMCLPVPMNNTV